MPKKKQVKYTPKLTLSPMKPEEALKRFMEADPKRVEADMRKLKRKGAGALSKG